MIFQQNSKWANMLAKFDAKDLPRGINLIAKIVVIRFQQHCLNAP